MALKVVLDTNRYVDLARGDPDALAVVQRAREVMMPFVVLAELRAGFLMGNRGADNESSLVRFLGQDRVTALYADDQTCHHYARVFAQLRRQGTPIPTNDMWIAALVLQHGAHLYARDRHFDSLPQLPRL